MRAPSRTSTRTHAKAWLNVPRARTRGAGAGLADYPPASRERAREAEGCGLVDATGIAPAREGRRHG